MQQREREKGGRKEREEERKDIYHLNEVLYVYFTIEREYNIPGYETDKIKETDNLVLVRMQQDLNLSDFGGGINQLFVCVCVPDHSSLTRDQTLDPSSQSAES